MQPENDCGSIFILFSTVLNCYFHRVNVSISKGVNQTDLLLRKKVPLFFASYFIAFPPYSIHRVMQLRNYLIQYMNYQG